MALVTTRRALVTTRWALAAVLLLAAPHLPLAAPRLPLTSLLLPLATPLAGQEAAAPEATPAATPAPSPAEAELRSRLERLLADPALARAHAGLVVQEAESGDVLFDHQGEKRFTAASVTKLLTAAVALHRLGPDHRWSTRLLFGGPVADGTLRGDLWLVGGGDPALTRERLRRWTERLTREGVQRVVGDLVGDDRAFSGSPWGRGWMWEDVQAGWGAAVSALQLDPPRVEALLHPAAEVGAAAELRFEEGEPAPAIELRVRTGAPGSEVRLDFLPRPEGAGPVLAGWVPVDSPPLPLLLAPADPTLHLLRHLGLALAREGIALEGSFRRPDVGEAPPGSEDGAAAWSASFESPPLEEVLVRAIKRSDNQVFESLLRTLGRERGRAGTAAEGLAAVGATLAGWGIDPGAVALADGSGLSRYTELTPAALVRVLRRFRQLPEFEVLRRALPVGGVDGTLAGRFSDTAGEENVRAKTGSLSGVRALAGYVEDARGETLVFALLLNGYAAPGRVATAIEDLLVEQLALFGGPGYPDGPP